MQTQPSLSSVRSSDSRGRSRPTFVTVGGLSPPSSLIARATSGSHASGSQSGGSKLHVAHPALSPSALLKQKLAGNQNHGAGTRDQTSLAKPLRGSQSSHGRLGVRSPPLRMHASRTPSVNSINAHQLTPFGSGRKLTAYDQQMLIQQPLTVPAVQNRGSSGTSAGSASSRHGLQSLHLRPLRSDTHTGKVPVSSLSSSRSWISLSPVGSKILSQHDQLNKKSFERKESEARLQPCSLSARGHKLGAAVQGTDVWPVLGVRRTKIQFEEQVTEARYEEAVDSMSSGRLAPSGSKRESRNGILKKTPSFGLQATSSNAVPEMQVTVSDLSSQKSASQTDAGQRRSTDLMPDSQALKGALFQTSIVPQWKSQDVMSPPQQDRIEERYTVGFVNTFSNPLFTDHLIPTFPQLQVPLLTTLSGRKLWDSFPAAASARTDSGKDTVSSAGHSSTHPPSSEQQSIGSCPPRPTPEPTPESQNQMNVLTAASFPQVDEMSPVDGVGLAASLPAHQQHTLSDEDLLTITTSRPSEEDKPTTMNDNVTRRKIPRNFYSNYEEMRVPEVSSAARKSAKLNVESEEDDRMRQRSSANAMQNMGFARVTDMSAVWASVPCPQSPNLPQVTMESQSRSEEVSPSVTSDTSEKELHRDDARNSTEATRVTVSLQPLASESDRDEGRDEEYRTTAGQFYTASEAVSSEPRKPVHITRIVQGGVHDQRPIKWPETFYGPKAPAAEDYFCVQDTSALDKFELEPLVLGHVETDPSCSGINDTAVCETDAAAAEKEIWSEESKLEEFEPMGLTGTAGAAAPSDETRQRRLRLLESMGIKSCNKSDHDFQVEEKRHSDQMAVLNSLDVIQAEDVVMHAQRGNEDQMGRERATDITKGPWKILTEDVTTMSLNPPRETTAANEGPVICETSNADSGRQRHFESSAATQSDFKATSAHTPNIPPTDTKDAAQDESELSDRRIVEYLPQPIKPRWRVAGEDEEVCLQVELRIQPAEIVACAVDAEKQEPTFSREVIEAETKAVLTREALTADEKMADIASHERWDLLDETARPDINLSTGQSSDELTAMEALIITPDSTTDAKESTVDVLQPAGPVEEYVDSSGMDRFPESRRLFREYPVHRGSSAERLPVGSAISPEQQNVVQREHVEYCLKEAVERFMGRVAVPGACETSSKEALADAPGATSPSDDAEPTTSQKELQVTYLGKPRQGRYLSDYRPTLPELSGSSRGKEQQDIEIPKVGYGPARARVIHHRASKCTIRKIDPGVLTYLVEVYPVVTDTQENQSDLVMAEEELLVSEILEQITGSTLKPSEAKTDGGYGPSRDVPNVLSSESLTQLRHSYAAKVADKILSKAVVGEDTSVFPIDQKIQPSDPVEQSTSCRKERAGQPDTAAKNMRDTKVSNVAAGAEPRDLMSVYFEALPRSVSGSMGPPDKEDALRRSRKENSAKLDSSFERDDGTPTILATSGSSDDGKFRMSMATTDDIRTLLLLPWGEATTSITLSAVWTRHQHTPCGFFVATNINQDSICGAVSVLLFDNDVATCTFFLLMPEYDFKDLGHLLWDQVLRFCKGKDLTTVAPQADSIRLLERYPFHVSDAGTILRGPVTASADDFKDVVPVVEYNKAFFSALAAYDKDIFGFDRERFLGYTLKEDGLVVRIALGKDEGIRGYAAVQTDRWRTPVLRWLIADDYAAAESLLHNLIRACCDEGPMVVLVAFYTQSPIAKAIRGKTSTSSLTPWQVLYNRTKPDFSWHKIVSLADL